MGKIFNEMKCEMMCTGGFFFLPYFLKIFIFCIVIRVDIRNVVTLNNELVIVLIIKGCIFIFHKPVPCKMTHCTVLMLSLCVIVVRLVVKVP